MAKVLVVSLNCTLATIYSYMKWHHSLQLTAQETHDTKWSSGYF